MAWELVPMEPSNPSSAPSTTASLTAQHGVDMLWRYQLRKESAALLEKLDASERMIEDITSETTRKLRETAERISTLETKLDSIDNDGQKLREAKQKWDDDVAAMKARMGIVTEIVIPETQPISEPPQLPEQTVTAAELAEDVPFLTSSSSPPETTVERVNGLITVSDESLPATGALTPTISSATESGQLVTMDVGPMTRSRNKSRDSTTSINAPVETPRPNPRIFQGTNSLATYHKNASIAFTSISKDRHSEIDFIGQFIKGIQEPKTRNMLVDELQQAHPCRTNKDGKVEILCEWADVAEGLNKLGLLASERSEAPRQSQVVRRKKKILIPRELIESGMMR